MRCTRQKALLMLALLPCFFRRGAEGIRRCGRARAVAAFCHRPKNDKRTWSKRRPTFEPGASSHKHIISRQWCPTYHSQATQPLQQFPSIPDCSARCFERAPCTSTAGTNYFIIFIMWPATGFLAAASFLALCLPYSLSDAPFVRSGIFFRPVHH